MRCDIAHEEMSAALDGELSPKQRAGLDAHLASCPHCRKRFEELADQSRLLREMDCEVPEGLRTRILAALPEQVPAKAAPVVNIRRWATLAACLVLVVGAAFAFALPGRMDKAAPMAEDAASYALADADSVKAVDMIPAESAMPMAPAEEQPAFESGMVTDPIRAVRYQRVEWTEALENEALLITDEEALAQLSARYPTAFSPEDYDLTQVQLIAVTLSEGSGSVSHEVEGVLSADGGTAVVIRRHVPEAGTCDMAGWLILVEVDPIFPQGETAISLTVY